MRWFACGVVATLAACAPAVESDAPLFTAGAETLKPGLWAMVGKKDDLPCPTPTDAAVMRWPECAAPVLVEKDTLTYLKFGAIRTAYLLADGAPRILQLDRNLIADLLTPTTDSNAKTPSRRYYLAFAPATPPPYRAGQLGLLLCPDEMKPSEAESAEPAASEDQPEPASKPQPAPPIAGLRWVGTDENGRCIADRPEAVREVARRLAKEAGENPRLVWIAPYP